MDCTPTPPIPPRHPNHHPLPPIPTSPSPATARLIPPPLFSSKRTPRLPPNAIRVAIFDVNSSPIPSSEPLSLSSTRSPNSSPTSMPSSSGFSFSSHTSSSSSLSSSFSSSPPSAWGPTPQVPSLRRKKSPKRETLRALRAKDSDACLQRVYERQTMAYLEGRVLWMGVLEE